MGSGWGRRGPHRGGSRCSTRICLVTWEWGQSGKRPHRKSAAELSVSLGHWIRRREREWRADGHLCASLAYLFLRQTWLVSSQGMPPGVRSSDSRWVDKVGGEGLYDPLDMEAEEGGAAAGGLLLSFRWDCSLGLGGERREVKLHSKATCFPGLNIIPCSEMWNTNWGQGTGSDVTNG